MLKVVSVLATLGLIGGAGLVYAARSSTLPDRLSMITHENIDLGGGPAPMPGIWMDHCHNLDHAAAGMTMHLAYEGVTTPYLVGHASGNQPE
jgi:Multicopper oxidase